MMTTRIQNIAINFAWSLAPLLWGLFSLLLAKHVESYQLRMLLEAVSALVPVLWYFGSSFTKNQKEYIPTVFGHRLQLMPWQRIVAAITNGYLVLLFLTLFVDLKEYVVIMRGTFMQPLIEELLSQSLFVSSIVTWPSFVVFKAVSAVSFALMHFSSYTFSASSIAAAISNHGLFNLNLGIIAFRTRSIAVPILLHIASNLDYVITTTMLGMPYSMTHGMIKLGIMLLGIFAFSCKEK